MNTHRIGLNCSLAPPPTTTSCHTPNTPEILNAIVNISFPQPPPATTCHQPSFPQHPTLHHSSSAPLPSPCYSDSSTASSTGSPLASPSGLHSSVQHIHSQFIKEGLEMKVKQKLKTEPEEGGAESPSLEIKREFEDLTPEDEE